MTRLTIKNLQTAFGVSHMTISAWRKGSKARKPLPTAKTEDSAVLFNVGPTQKWAERNGIEILVPLASLVGQGIIKRGPKPKQVPALLKAHNPKDLQAIRKAQGRKP